MECVSFEEEVVQHTVALKKGRLFSIKRYDDQRITLVLYRPEPNWCVMKKKLGVKLSAPH